MEVCRLSSHCTVTLSDSPDLVVWRIVVGISLIPAFGTLYQRLTLPESTRFIASQKPAEETLEDLKRINNADPEVSVPEKGATAVPAKSVGSESVSSQEQEEEIVKKKAHFGGKLISTWR